MPPAWEKSTGGEVGKASGELEESAMEEDGGAAVGGEEEVVSGSVAYRWCVHLCAVAGGSAG